MKSLVLQDHFSAHTEALLLDIEQEDLLTQGVFERDRLLIHKLSEASRVLLAKKLLLKPENCLEEFVSGQLALHTSYRMCCQSWNYYLQYIADLSF